MKRVTAAAVFLAMLVGSVSLAWATSASAPKTKSAPSAKVIIEDLAKLGLPARLTVAFTGRLIRITYWGARTATCQKQALVISVSQPRTPRGDSKGDVDYGGSVEVFATANEAKARAVYIESVLKADPMLGTEYDYLNGPVLLRVSQYLIPSQAEEYQRALAKIKV